MQVVVSVFRVMREMVDSLSVRREALGKGRFTVVFGH